MSTLQAPAPQIALDSVTPMLRQYLETKAQHTDAILFFRLGDFYEMFFEDAVVASQVLGITLTSRASKSDDRVPMCGFPFHSARGYVAKLISQGYKVAICEQVEDPATAKNIVKREVTQVITPGMVLDDDILDARADHFLAAVAPLEESFGLAFLDVSTGEFRVAQIGDRRLLLDELGRAAPREVILPPNSPLEEEIRTICPAAFVHDHDEEAFDPRRGAERLCRQLQVASLDGFGIAHLAAATAAAGAALAYLGETQRQANACHVDRIQVFHPEGHLVLDEATRNNLELSKTLQGAKKKGSLLGLLDKTLTAMGGRVLSRWILYPLLDLEEIRGRHDAVEELVGGGILRDDLAGLLREVGDLERLLGRLSLRAGNARDCRALGHSLGKLPALRTTFEGCRAPLLRSLAPDLTGLEGLAGDLTRAIADEPPITTREGGMFRLGWDPELDELIELSASGKEYLARLEAKEKERTGISSLKVRYNKVFGYFIEVTRANLHLVPEDYVRKQTTVNAERFITDDLKKYEEKVLTAEERRIEKETALFETLRDHILEHAGAIKRAAAAVATGDTLLALARVAVDHDYVRPEVDDSDGIEIVEGRHPVVERSLSGGEAFVPNDVSLDRTSRQVVVITGPNMAGKSTVLRQTALIALMAQAGSFVPASSARVGLVDRIFCRVGASDNLARGQSTFMVEMVETAAILHGATERSLVVLDEIGRGTSTFDGLSIAWSVAEHLHDRVGARTLFATHYHELTELARERPRVKNATVAVSEQGGRVIFLRKLISGGASRSYGIEVARLAGVPGEVLERAREILANLERNELDPEGRAIAAKSGRGRRQQQPLPDQLGLFAPKAPSLPAGAKEVLDRLEKVSVDQTSPLQALVLLAELKEMLGR